MTTDLDSRLNSMAGALRHAVPEAPPPRRPPGPGRVVVGTALVLLAAVGAFTAVRSDGTRDVDSAQVVNLRGLVADQLPDGLELSWAGQQTGQITEDGVAGAGGSVSDLSVGPVELHTYLYGAVAGAAPFGSDDLVVNVWERAEGLAPFDAAQTAAALTGSVESTVNGQAAVVCDKLNCSGTGTGEAISSVHWVTAQGQEIVAASRSLDAAQLQAIADELKVDGTNLVLGALPPELAGKLAEVGSLAETFVAGARQVDAYWVGYADAVAGGRAVDVTTSAGDVDDLMAAVWALGDSAEQLEVRGKKAFLAGTGGAEGAIELVWQEGEDVVARVSAVGLDQEQLIAFVEGLRFVADGEWRKVEELAAAARAALPTTLPAAPGSVEGNVSVDAGDTDVDADVSVSEDGVDVDVSVDTPVGQLEASLHTGVGAEAVIGPLTAGAEALTTAGQQAAEQAQEQMTNPTMPTVP